MGAITVVYVKFCKKDMMFRRRVCGDCVKVAKGRISVAVALGVVPLNVLSHNSTRSGARLIFPAAPRVPSLSWDRWRADRDSNPEPSDP